MFIYNGKFNWAGKTAASASNETITVVFPAGFALNDPVSAYWQWSTDAAVNKASASTSVGAVNNVTTTADGYSRIHFSFGYYTFDATITADYKTLTLTMGSGKDVSVSRSFNLAATHINPASLHSTVVFTGTLEWLPYAKREMTTLVVPYGVTEGAFFGLYHQWSIDPTGVEKTNAPVNGVFQNVKYAADGTITTSFTDTYYTYQFVFNGMEASWVVSNSKGDKSQNNKLRVTYKV